MGKWVKVPVPERLDMRAIWEHPPLDYYRYGEYPNEIVRRLRKNAAEFYVDNPKEEVK